MAALSVWDFPIMFAAERATYPGAPLIGHAVHTSSPEVWSIEVQTAARCVTVPEFVRFRAENGISGAIVQAVRQELEADGVPLPPIDEPSIEVAA